MLLLLFLLWIRECEKITESLHFNIAFRNLYGSISLCALVVFFFFAVLFVRWIHQAQNTLPKTDSQLYNLLTIYRFAVVLFLVSVRSKYLSHWFSCCLACFAVRCCFFFADVLLLLSSFQSQNHGIKPCVYLLCINGFLLVECQNQDVISRADGCIEIVQVNHSFFLFPNSIVPPLTRCTSRSKWTFSILSFSAFAFDSSPQLSWYRVNLRTSLRSSSSSSSFFASVSFRYLLLIFLCQLRVVKGKSRFKTEPARDNDRLRCDCNQAGNLIIWLLQIQWNILCVLWYSPLRPQIVWLTNGWLKEACARGFFFSCVCV